MRFAGINFAAVIVAAVVAWAASAAWYIAFGRIWAVARGKPARDLRDRGGRAPTILPFLYAFVADIVIAWVLAGVLGHLGPGQVTLRNGVISAAFCWFGFILTTMTANYSFAARDHRLLLIDCGNWLVVLLLIGAVIGAIGV